MSMLYQITAFLLDVVTGLLGAACLLRLYMQSQRIPFGNPVGRFVFALTDWLVLPLRRVFPAFRHWDTASLVGAYLLQLAQFGLLWLLAGRGAGAELVLLQALLGLLRLILSTLTVLLVVYAIMSWVGVDSPVGDVIDRLCAPILRPFRRVIPLVGGFDLSPLALLVLLQVGAIVVGSLQAGLLR
jgi:YggT family protein